jgi:hypothetical protein
MKEYWWPYFKYWILHKADRRQKQIVRFKPESSSEYSLSSFARKWQNTFQQGIDILQKTF